MVNLFRTGLVSLVIMFLGISNIVSAEEINIVKNSSFEEVDARGMLVDWVAAKRVKKEFAEKVEMSLSKEAHSGKYSAYIKRMLDLLDEEQPRASGWFQYLELAPNTTYKASCWIKTNIEKGQASILYTSYTGVSKTAGKVRRTFDWRYYEFVFTTPEAGELTKGKECYIYPALFKGRGEVWIDDVKIVKADSVEA